MKIYFKSSAFIFFMVFAFGILAGEAEARPALINAGGRIIRPEDSLGIFLDVPNSNPSQTTLVSATWAYNTKPGNFLVAVINFRGGSGVTITPPPGLGWTLAVRSSNDHPNSSGLPISTAIYYIKNAATQFAPVIHYIDIPNGNLHQPAPSSQQTPVYSTWKLSSPNIEAALALAEWTGIDKNSPLDVSGSDMSSLNNSANDVALGRSGLTDPVRYTEELVVGSIAVANRGNGFVGEPQDLTDISMYPVGYVHTGYDFSAGTGEISYKDALTLPPDDLTPDLTKGVANINISRNPPPVGTKVGVKVPIEPGRFYIPGEATLPGFVWLPGEDQSQPRTHLIPLNPVAWAGAIATFKSNSSVGKTNGGNTGGKTIFKRDLTIGSRGADVTALQDFLIKNGFLKKSAIKNGYFSSSTKEAVTKWQVKNKLNPANGYVGSKSRRILSAQ